MDVLRPPNVPYAVSLPAHGAVYVEVPKVACSSVKIALAGLLGIDLDGVDGNPHEARFPEPPEPSPGPRAYPDSFSFAFVRNPWDRLVSCYRDKIRGETRPFTGIHPERGIAFCLAGFGAFHAGMSFDAFVDAVAGIVDDEADPHFRSQHTFVCNGAGESALDFVGRFESLAADVRTVCTRIGATGIELPRVQVTRPRRPYAGFYDRRTSEVVAERFAEDIRRFGYEFGPRSRRPG